MAKFIDLEIRLALPEDAGAITALYRQLVNNFVVSVLPERIAKITQDANTSLFVCDNQGRVCGTALVSLCADVMFNAQPFAVVENIVIDADMRSQGIGGELLQYIEDYCLDKDCSKIMLLSSIHREQAHQFFERVGYVGSIKRGFVKYRSNFRVSSTNDYG
jgi:N-acetylglutamate synthase-like GNAT family acetyltransferase